MARKIFDSVVETSTSTGTGNITLAGAVTGYLRFEDDLFTGDLVTYLIEAIDGNGDRTGQWETGNGTYSATDTLTRTAPYDGSTVPPVNFSAGTKRVSLSHTAEVTRFRGALAYKSADQTAANYTTATAITFDTDSYDTSTIHDTAVNTSRLTVPAMVTKVRVAGHAAVASFVGSQWYALYIYKNGSVAYVGSPGLISYDTITTAEIETETPILDVVAGDYFELFLHVGADTSITVSGTRTWFAMEVIE